MINARERLVALTALDASETALRGHANPRACAMALIRIETPDRYLIYRFRGPWRDERVMDHAARTSRSAISALAYTAEVFC
jgi:hypothetical protein